MSTTEPVEEAPEYAVQHAREQLATDPRTSELEVTVTVAGGKVFLHGSASSEERRDSIGIVAAEALPDYEICNHVAVMDLRPPAEAEDL